VPALSARVARHLPVNKLAALGWLPCALTKKDEPNAEGGGGCHQAAQKNLIQETEIYAEIYILQRRCADTNTVV
jgi:hypothetical protein